MTAPLTQEHFDARLEEILLAVKAGFDDTASKAELAVVKATMVTKDYLDDKLADLKGDLIVKLRKEDAKVEFLISLLRSRAIITDDDLRKFRTEFQVFPIL